MADLAGVVRRIPGSDFSNGREQRMNRAYFRLVQTDMLLWAAVVRKYDTSPEDFDPPGDPPAVLRPDLPPPARPSNTRHAADCPITLPNARSADECTTRAPRRT
jgi:hypothetical protein